MSNQKKQSEKYNKSFLMKLTEKEAEEFEKYAIQSGVTKSTIVRKLLQKESIFKN